MKRIFLFAAALFAAVSCAEVGIEELATVTDSDAATNVSVLVSAIDSADSRISVDDAWAATWDEGDALTAWSSGDGALTMFEMTSYDAEASTFSGAVTGDYRLIYPYDAAAVVDGGSYTVDLVSQVAGVNNTYMISTTVELSAMYATATMSHIGAAAELVSSFKNLEGSYTLTKVAISGVPTSVAINLGAEVTADDFYGEATVGTMMVDVEDVAVSSSEKIYTRFNILPFEVAAGESISVKYYFEDESGASFYAVSTVANGGDSAVAFDRATYNTINSSCDMSTVATNATTLALADISADAIPEVDTWIITDSSATADNFAGLKAAIVALDNSGREISLEFTNLTDFPASALASTSSTLDMTALVSVKADAALTFANYVFYYCDGLKSASAPLATTAVTGLFGYCTSLVDVDLPSLTTTSHYLFRGCSSIKEIYLPSLTTSGNYATNYCSSLESISMPKLTTTGWSAFGYCESLVEVNLPSMVTYGNYTFQECTALETIELASTVTTFGYNFVYGCTNLKSINCDNNSNFTFEDGMMMNTAKTTVYSALPYFTKGVVELSSDVTAIGDYAFAQCSDMTSFSAPSVTTIGMHILRECTSLTSAQLPVLATYNYWTFALCTALEEIELPAATSFSGYNFYGCTGLKKMAWATNNGTKLTSVSSAMFTNVEISDIDLTVGAANSSYVSGSTLTVGNTSYTFKSITVLDEVDDSEDWTLVTAADGSTTGVWSEDITASIFTACTSASKEVEIYESKETPGYYRIKNIYTADFTCKIWQCTEEEEDGYAVDPETETYYTYIDATDPTAVLVVYHDTGYYSGSTYGNVWFGSYISSAFSSGSDDNYGTLVDGYISFPASSFIGILDGYSTTSGWLCSDGGTSLLLPGGTDPNAEPGEDPDEPTSDEFTADITVSDITTNSATISWTVTDQDQDYIYGLFTSEGLDSYSDADLMSAIVYTYNSSGILSSRTFSGDAYGTFTGLSASTAYSMFIFTIDSDENPSSPLSRADFTTAAESADGSDAYNAWLGTWNLTSTSLTDSGTSLTLQITISQDVANSSYSIYGFDLTTGRNSYAMPATYDSSTGGWSVVGSSEVGTYSSYTMMYCGYAYIGGSYNSYYIITGDYTALTGSISSDGTTGAVACGSSTISDGTAFTVATVKLFAYLSGTYYSFSNDTTNLAISSSDNLVGPFTLSKVSSSSAPAAAPAATQTTTGLNMMSDMIFNAMTAKVDSSLKSVGSLELSKAVSSKSKSVKPTLSTVSALKK